MTTVRRNILTLDVLVPLVAALPSAQGLVRQDGVGKLPALGWNSWNAFYCDITENDFLNAAQQMVNLGLKDAGYEYVNIDDCWSVRSGRDSNNQLVPDPTKFPDGISGTADRVHAMGLKFGIYSSAGTHTCAGFPASLGYEEIDAATFAAWGIDYLKYDNCNVPSNWTDECNACDPDSPDGGPFPNGTCTGLSGNYCPNGYDFSQSNTAKRYMIMRNALEAQNRTILYSLCEWGRADVQSWGNQTADSWRSTGDIFPNWNRILEILNQNSFYMNHVDFWGHSDPDMLEVGNGDLTAEENRSHFALWAAMKSPLLIGTDLTRISSDNVAILKNQYLLAFNQDNQYGAPAAPYKWGANPDWTFNASYPAQYWSGRFQQGTLVLILNLDNSTTQMTADWNEVPGLTAGAAYQVTEAWSGTALGCLTGGLHVQIPAHDTAVLVVGESCSPTRKRGQDVITLPLKM